ncbi:basic leucine zipper transcription factor [Lithospermum erythrorhizon]|uniref:Basic leucine zipper transcription factor n=1 Tax=Lithospermum erythrorhizon TaxID=34254 RepID=A0AAV3QUD0_LITER
MSSNELSRVSSSSSSSSASPFSPVPNQRAKTMEEVWKDINLSSLQDHLTSKDDPRATSFCGMTFQDFLARPFRTDNPISAGSAPNSSMPSATMLTLNSAQEIHFLQHYDPLKHNPFLQNQTIHQISQHQVPFDHPFVSASGSIPIGRKRFPESDHNNSSDRRHKKMIKNRESAARSRAYTNELELELAHLLEENAKLKKQQHHQKQWGVQQPGKRNLLRASSAPF